MDSGRATTRQYWEYSEIFSTQRKREYDQDTDRGSPLRSDGGGRDANWSGLHTGLPDAVDT